MERVALTVWVGRYCIYSYINSCLSQLVCHESHYWLEHHSPDMNWNMSVESKSALIKDCCKEVDGELSVVKDML